MPVRKACIDCGQPFAPRRRDQYRCPVHERGHQAVRAARGYQQPGWRRQSRAFLRGKVCAYCGSTHRLATHHLVPRPEGPDHPSNYLALCGSDHSAYEADVRHDRDTKLRRFVEDERQTRIEQGVLTP